MPYESNLNEVLGDLERAYPVAMDEAALTGVAEVKRVLSRVGTPSSKSSRRSFRRAQRMLNIDRTGQIISVRLPRKTRVSDSLRRGLVAAQEAATSGLVDPPGGYPRMRTGNLRRSITHDGRIGGTGQAQDADSRRIGADTSADAYAAVHEFGSKTVPARPYLRRTLLSNQRRMFDAFAKRIKGVFE